MPRADREPRSRTIDRPEVILGSTIFSEVKIAEPMGVGFLTAVLRRRGRTVAVIEPSYQGWSVETTARTILDTPSRVLGLSVHRDKNKPEVLELLERLRKAGDDRFIVLGGHGPSVGVPCEGQFDTIYARPSYGELARYADALVIGEGEVAFPDLVDAVLAGNDWRDLPGLAFADGKGGLIQKPAGPKIADLDTLPFMSRDALEWYLDRYGPPLSASVQVGRGCLYRCSFCTVHRFEALQPGPPYRRRSAAGVLEEVRELHQRYGVDDFTFEDDNLVAPDPAGRQWMERFLDGIGDLGFRITFNLFCRPDAVEAALFARLKGAGLQGVYLGVESVWGPDLKFFRKGLTQRIVFGALDILRELGYSAAVGAELRLMFGYITWHPLSSFDQLRASLKFVDQWRAPPKLLRRALRLYTGAAIKDQLAREGLLDGSRPSGWRYRDPRLAAAHQAVDAFFGQATKIRDAVRTAEKAMRRRGLTGETAARLRRIRESLDRRCLDFVSEVCRLSDGPEGAGLDGFGPRLQAFLDEELRQLASSVEGEEVGRVVDSALEASGLPVTGLLAPDLLRR